MTRETELNIKKLEQELEERKAVLLSRLRVKADDDSDEAINPDRADLAQDYFLQDRRRALMDRLEDSLEQVTGALERIETGEYGKCQHCGQQISPARLEALPYAELCIDCQEKRETGGST